MKGITILFHGDPGCGKTEYSLQLAKKTNRPLMKIDITDFQSKWLGESEKQLKQIFADYRTVCESNHNNIPILFLNECDQIIGKRISISSSLDQITNGIQNILLEEMESFNGILIGTSNLVNNMDEAFERRWLLKLQFTSPTQSARVHIWKSKIKGLKTKDALMLATQFDFTPAEISNIAKKYAMEKLLGLKKSQILTIIELGESERFIRQNQVRCVGF
jgi:SpoVK/Ycf46/Vps4 family AAA+-type ATPase